MWRRDTAPEKNKGDRGEHHSGRRPSYMMGSGRGGASIVFKGARRDGDHDFFLFRESPDHRSTEWVVYPVPSENVKCGPQHPGAGRQTVMTYGFSQAVGSCQTDRSRCSKGVSWQAHHLEKAAVPAVALDGGTAVFKDKRKKDRSGGHDGRAGQNRSMMVTPVVSKRSMVCSSRRPSSRSTVLAMSLSGCSLPAAIMASISG